MKDVFDSIISAAPTEIFYTLLGALLLFIAERLYHSIKRHIQQRFILREVKTYHRKVELINVIDLVNGIPEIEVDNILFSEISKFGETKKLFIDMSEEHKQVLFEKEQKYSYLESHKNIFHDDHSLDGSKNFEDLAQQTQILQLPELIEKHRSIVGHQFINSFNGLIYNDEKYGILSIRETRFGKTEKPGVEIDLFTTDYFTHRVFRSIYNELQEANHPIKTANQDNYLQYHPFLTSFGVNTLLICEGKNGKEIVLSKRSSRVHGNQSRFHITMNEGLNLLDKDPFGKINMENCLKRGLKEELGIDEHLYQLISKASFYDLFLERNKFEIGITSVVMMNINFSKHIAPIIAKDKPLEFDGFITLPLKMNEIKSFIKSNEFIPHGLYTLDRVLMREKIFSTSLLI